MKEFELHPQLARDCIHVTKLDLCQLLLMNNSHYPWCILVPMRADLREIYQLDDSEQQQVLRESSRLSRFMMEHFAGDKMNVAALGNLVPQLHIHHIVRRQTDNAWPAPVWGHEAALPYGADQADAICTSLREALSP